MARVKKITLLVLRSAWLLSDPLYELEAGLNIIINIKQQNSECKLMVHGW
jgi:hypothetical protein